MIIFALIFFFSIWSSYFLTLTNFRVLLENMSILTFLALGVHFLLVGGEIDISFTSVLAFSATMAAIASPGNTFIIILVALFAAVAVGMVNGFFVVKIGIPSFLVTLSTMVLIQGLVYVLNNYRSVSLWDNLIPQIFYGRFISDVSACVFWMIGLIVVAGIIMRYTRFGRWVYATGGNERAARLMGVSTNKVKFTLFIISSLLAGIAGLISVSRTLASRPDLGEGYLMPAIAAPILGGALLTGGKGSVIRTVLGSLVLTTIMNGVYLMGLEPAYRDVFMGVVLLTALSARLLQLKVKGTWLGKTVKFIKRKR
jgi:ribose/xylose/arabinose/galactoside ABC-type transport system permease subunit